MSSYNKIVVNGVTKIDLTNDTVESDALLAGYSAHASDGSIVEGILFKNWPEVYTFTEELLDSSGNIIVDDSNDILNLYMPYFSGAAHRDVIDTMNTEIQRLNSIIDELQWTLDHTVTDSFDEYLVTEDYSIS